MKINARIAAMLLSGACLAAPALAQRDKLKHTPNISLNISVRKDSVRTTYLNVGLLTNIHRLKGIGINVVSSIVQGDMAGFQLSGLASITGKDASGFQLGGIANVTGGNANGVMLGGLMNVAGGKTNGIQISGLGNITGNASSGITVGGLMNVTGNQARGIQIGGLANIAGDGQNGLAIGGLMNVSGKELNGLQVSSLLNVSGGKTKGIQTAAIGNVGIDVSGMQLAAVGNIATKEIKGVQFALGNYAGMVNGAQIGLLNLCRGKVKGVQIGIINHSKDTTAHKVGLVNIDPKTRMQMLLFAGNVGKLNAAVRFKNRRTYSMLGIGTHYLGLNDKFSGCVFYRTGLHFLLAKKVEISGDLGYCHIENFENEDAETPKRMYSLQGRINLECRIAHRLGLFASGGYGITRYYDKNKSYEKKPIIELGVVLF